MCAGLDNCQESYIDLGNNLALLFLFVGIELLIINGVLSEGSSGAFAYDTVLPSFWIMSGETEK